MAPCTLEVDRGLYEQNIAQALLYLEGRVEDLKKTLARRMEALSREMAYEQAAEVRDRLLTIEATSERMRVVAVTKLDQDALGLARSDDRAAVAALFFRRGRLVGMREERLRRTNLPDDEILSSFLGQYYGSMSGLPHEILLHRDIDDRGHLEEILSGLHDRRVRLIAPRRGRRKELVNLAMENASRILDQWDRLEDPVHEKLDRLQGRLSLPGPPSRMECVDISHTSGRQTVGSMSVMIDGSPAASLYRRFRIRSAAPGDDYGAMHELLSRRFRRAQQDQKGWEPPDLLLVDGGKGQLRIAEEVVRELNVEGVALAAIAKDRRRQAAAEARKKVKARLSAEKGETAPAPEKRSYDTIYLPGRATGIPVRGPSSPLILLVRLRDEAHRFAVAYHRKVRSKQTIATRLTDIPGVGPVTARRLLEAFGSIDGIRRATEEELVGSGVACRVAALVKKHL
jgi:excinuclease ABC subunit C